MAATIDLLGDTKRRLRDLPRWLSLSQVARESGLKLAWLSALSSGAIPDPGVKKVQQLHNYLTLVPTRRPPEKIPFEKITDIKEGGLGFPHIMAVYEFYAGDTCIYVGCSENLGKRLYSHSRSRKLINMGPTHAVITYCDGSLAEAKKLEKAKISAFDPPLNIQHTSRDARAKKGSGK